MGNTGGMFALAQLEDLPTCLDEILSTFIKDLSVFLKFDNHSLTSIKKVTTSEICSHQQTAIIALI